MKKELISKKDHFEFKIYYKFRILSVLFDFMMKIRFINQKQIVFPGEKTKIMKEKYDVSIFKIENIKENGKYVKIISFIPNKKFKNKHKDDKIFLNIKILFYNFYNIEKTDCFKINGLIYHFNYDFYEMIEQIKDMNKRIENVYKNRKIRYNQHIQIGNSKIFKIINKYKDVENELTTKLKKINIDILTMLYCSYVYSGSSTLLMYPATYFKVGRKYNNQPDNIDYGFILSSKNKKYKLYKFLYKIIYFNNIIEDGYIATNGLFYNNFDALKLATKNEQIEKPTIGKLNENTLK